MRQAERDGSLRPGGVIVEGTSGNTGIGLAMVGVVDRFERIPDRESLTVTRRLAREEGLLVGGSAGTAVAGAMRTAAGLGPEHLVVAVLPDSGRKYLSK